MRPMSILVQTLGRLIAPFAITFGLYLVLHGHLTPGGGFQGGAVMASVIAMLIISYGRKISLRTISKEWLSKIESGGLLAFIGLMFLGIGATSFYNFLARGGPIFSQQVQFGPNIGYLNTAGSIPLYSLAVGLEVLAGLGIIVIMFALASVEVEE